MNWNVLVSVAGIVFSIVTGAQAAVNKKGVMTLHLSDNPKTLNPIIANDNNSNKVIPFIYSRLLELDRETLAVLPSLAESYEISKDKKDYTFTLNAKARWDDGTPVTTEDVQYSWETAMNPKTFAAHMRAYYVGVTYKTIDARKFQFHIDKPQPNTFMALYDFEVVQKKQFVGEKDFNLAKGAMNPVGNGPYRLVQFSRDQKLELELKKDWWGFSYPHYKDQYNFDRLLFRMIADPNLQYERFLKGDIDVMDLLMPGLDTYVNKVRGTDKDRIGQKPEDGKPVWANHFDNKSLRPYTFIGWNLRQPMFASVKTRRALSMLVDTKQIAEKVYHGFYFQCTSPFGSKSMFSDPELQKPGKILTYNQKKALELLKEDGWADTDGDNVLNKTIDGKQVPFRFSLKFNSNNQMRSKIAQMVKETFKAAGIDVQVQAIEWNAYLDDINKRKFDAYILGWMPSLTMNPRQVWHSSSYENAGSNAGGYNNPKVDALIERANLEFDLKKRAKIFQELSRIIYEDQPYTFLVEQGVLFGGFSNRVKMKKPYLNYAQEPSVETYSAQ